MIFDLKFDESKNFLYSVSDDRSLRVWSLKDCKCINELYGHSARPLRIELFEDFVFTGGADQCIFIWKWKNLQLENPSLFLFHKILLNDCGYIRSLLHFNSYYLVCFYLLLRFF